MKETLELAIRRWCFERETDGKPFYGCKANLQDADWTAVDGDEEKYNFFKVTVEMK